MADPMNLEINTLLQPKTLLASMFVLIENTHSQEFCKSSQAVFIFRKIIQLSKYN